MCSWALNFGREQVLGRCDRGSAITIRGLADESVSLARHRLDEAGALDVLTQGSPNFADGGIDAVLGIDEYVLPPEALNDLLASNDLPIFFEKEEKQLHGDAFELQQLAVPSQLEARTI